MLNKPTIELSDTKNICAELRCILLLEIEILNKDNPLTMAEWRTPIGESLEIEL
jgi:hypothetical protein